MTYGAQPGDMVAARYRLVRERGSGGMGRVWEAHDERLDTRVAVKELWLPASMAPGDRAERLRRAEFEAHSAAKLRDHPHIVTVHDIVVEDERPWIVMQLVSGGSLHERLARGRLPVPAARRVASALLGALGAAHRLGIVHRDVKPANVMVTGERGILLTDFGIATEETGTGPGMTTTGAVIGSAPYLAPERARGGRARAASDLFSLGVTLFEAVEGVSPFHRDSAVASLHAVAYDEPPRLRRAGTLAPLITALLAKDPDDRPGVDTARTMLASSTTRREGATEEETRREGATGEGGDGARDGGGRPGGSEQRRAPKPPRPPKKTRELPGERGIPSARTARLRVANESTATMCLRVGGTDVGQVGAGETSTFRVEHGVRCVQVRAKGITTNPWALSLGADSTTRLRAVIRDDSPVLGRVGDANRPVVWCGATGSHSGAAGSSGTKKSTAGAKASSGSSGGGWAVGVLVLLVALGLYADNAAFAGAVSRVLHGSASAAEPGDCVYFNAYRDGEGKEAEFHREWVRVPCWSGVDKREVRVAASATAQPDTAATSTGRSGANPLTRAPCAVGLRAIQVSDVVLCTSPR